MATRKRRYVRGDPQGDPVVRLLAAVTMQAVVDFLMPAKSTRPADRFTAESFCRSEEGIALVARFAGLSKERVKNDLFGDDDE